MTDHFRHIYQAEAALYDRMVSQEDYEGNLLPALARIRALDGLDVVEFGAGTGRITRLLAPEVQSIRAFDASEHMLDVARSRLANTGDNWELAVADNRAMPVGDHAADLTIAGWSLSHGTVWYGDDWQAEVGRMVGEMLRILKPDGAAIIIETLGTGNEFPAPPGEHLAAYYQWLETEHGFSTTWIRTDFRFTSVKEADELARFFFGDELGNRVVREQMTVLPECTGIWWKHV